MKNYPHILSKVFREPWLITKEKHETIQQILEAHLSGDAAAVDFPEDADSGAPDPVVIGSTMIMPIHGVIGKHLSNMELLCGGFCLDRLSEWIDKAENNWQIKSVVMDFRSPGGTVTGVPEAADKISKMSKDVLAFTDDQCCSAALWLASQADEFFCTESAIVGSVGVYSIYTDRSKQLEEDGIKVNPISSGKYKLAGAWFKPMTDDERKMLQARCDSIYEKFKTAATAVRKVDDEFLQGQVFYGDEAAKIGMVSGLVDSMEDVLALTAKR